MVETSQGFGSVDWAKTAKITLARSLSSSLLWCVVAVIAKAVPLGGTPGFFFQMLLNTAIGAPLVHFMVRGVRAVIGGLPFVELACNLLLVLISVLVAIGDPIVFAVNRQFPDLLGISGFKPINLVPAFFIYR